MMDYIWYVGYGSNLSEQRFFCYIRGGTPSFGKTRNDGCKSDQRLPAENRSIVIHYPLYFALPDNLTETRNWGRGGVAFIRHEEEKESKTLCRMWKIKREQYREVRIQEGSSWYGKEIELGEEGGLPIYTITNKEILKNILLPSREYIRTIAVGLKETYNLNEEEIVDYLFTKEGISSNLEKEALLKMIRLERQ
jgi:hypothetical protein